MEVVDVVEKLVTVIEKEKEGEQSKKGEESQHDN